MNGARPEAQVEAEAELRPERKLISIDGSSAPVGASSERALKRSRRVFVPRGKQKFCKLILAQTGNKWQRSKRANKLGQNKHLLPAGVDFALVHRLRPSWNLFQQRRLLNSLSLSLSFRCCCCCCAQNLEMKQSDARRIGLDRLLLLRSMGKFGLSMICVDQVNEVKEFFTCFVGLLQTQPVDCGKQAS